MDELVAFVRAQLDEDERVARELKGRAWKFHPAPRGEGKPVGVLNLGWHEILTSTQHDIRNAEAEHIARWDPARVLAEVEAKRRILSEYEDYASDDDPDYEHAQFAADAANALEAVIKLLAQPYAGRPGWREEWRA